MAQDKELAQQLNDTFQALIDEETRGLPTLDSPLIVKREGAGLSLIIHDCIQKRINELATKLDIPKAEAKASFVSAVMDGLLPKIGINLENKDFDRITVERRTKRINVPVKVINPIPPNFGSAGFVRVEDGPLDPHLHTPKEFWSQTTVDGIVIEKPIVIHELRRVAHNSSHHIPEVDYSHSPSSYNVVTVRPPAFLPRPTGLARHDDQHISIETAEYTVEQLVEERLKQHAGEMRAILEEALKQKRPIFNLRLFEGRFLSPQIGGDEESDGEAITWKNTAVNGIREGLKFTVKSLTSVAISGMVLFASNYVGHWVRPDVVPAPTTVIAAVAEQFKNVEMEVSGEGVKLTAKKEDAADDNEAKRLLDNIGGSSAPIEKQKALVKYLETKYAEGLVSGVPLVKATVVEKVRALVKENETGLAQQVKDAVAKATTVKTAIPTDQPGAKNGSGSIDMTMSR